MKTVWRSFIMAFSEYSISPKAAYERNKENCGAILLFIPLVGLIIGVCINRWGVAYPYLCNYSVFPAVVGAVLPILLSAGSHLNGFFRTVDALCSHKYKEERIRILSEDAHGGYFAIIVCTCFFLVSLGIWSEMPIEGCFLVSFQYVISRSLYGIALLTMKHAADGKADAFIPEKDLWKWIQVIILAVYVVVSAVWMISIHRSVGIACLLAAALAYIYCMLTANKNFGGVMEEIAGYFVVLCEIIVPIAALFVYKKWF